MPDDAAEYFADSRLSFGDHEEKAPQYDPRTLARGGSVHPRMPKGRKARKHVGLPPPGGSDEGKDKGRGLFGKLVDAVFGRKEEAQADRSKTDGADGLTAYRRRAAELAEMAREALKLPAADRLAELGALAVRLRDLLEDLRSVGADQAEVKPLQLLETELRALLNVSGPAEAEVERMLKKCGEVLGKFGGSA
jgi:hypothetical protein